ncbi:MAG: M3 family metallopeptidase [Polyangiaceae bacterium]
MTAGTNPLLEIGDPVRFDTILAEHVVPAISALTAAASARIDAIASSTAAPTLENTLLDLEDATEKLERAHLLAEHMESVATTPAFREAWSEAQPKISEFWSKLPLHDGLYARLSAFAATPAARALDGVNARLLQKTLDEFKKHGAELPAAGKRELTEIDVELARLTTKFSQNVLDSTNAFELVVTDEARVAGLPELARLAARKSAESRGLAGFRFTLHAPSFIPAITYLEDRSLREQLFRAYNERASSGDFDNRELIRRILDLRRRKAKLLGFADFADFVTSDRMAKSGDRAGRFIEDLRAHTRRSFDAEKAALREFAGHELAPWDVAFYSERLRKKLYDFDEELLRPYFALESVLSGVFEILNRLYGVRFALRDLPTWAPEVKAYHLLGAGDRVLASVYVDLFPRENKVQGAWMAPLRTGVAGVPHAAVVAANFTPPMGNIPALLSHREVETLFHEFGHLMHQCLSDVPVRKLAGTAVAWDFVELPSQIMENWTWERPALDLFAKHHETGATIPDSLFQPMLRARTYRAASAQMQQLGYAELDLYLHRKFEPSSAEDPVAAARDILARHVTAALPPTYAMIASFSHLFGGAVGYAAGYYSYKWAEVLDADAFGRFQEQGIFNPEAGGAFRDSILARGDSEDPEILYRRFRGRDATVDALLSRQGLAASASG